MLCTKFHWNWSSGSREEHFQVSFMYNCYVVIISRWKKLWPFILINLKPPSPKHFLRKVWLSSGEESIFATAFLSLLKRMEWPQSWPNFTQGCFVPNLVEIGSEVLEKKNLNFVIVYVDHFAFAPLREGCGPLIELT